jgi:hypothetical protein
LRHYFYGGRVNAEYQNINNLSWSGIFATKPAVFAGLSNRRSYSAISFRLSNFSPDKIKYLRGQAHIIDFAGSFNGYPARMALAIWSAQQHLDS